MEPNVNAIHLCDHISLYLFFLTLLFIFSILAFIIENTLTAQIKPFHAIK